MTAKRKTIRCPDDVRRFIWWWWFVEPEHRSAEDRDLLHEFVLHREALVNPVPSKHVSLGWWEASIVLRWAKHVPRWVWDDSDEWWRLRLAEFILDCVGKK